jgi:hypothetical protein
VNATPSPRFFLVSALDGRTRAVDGQSYPRWALVLSRDGEHPIRSAFGRRMPVVSRTTSGIRAPDWHGRAASFVRIMGGCTADQAGVIADWFRSHRNGSPVHILKES